MKTHVKSTVAGGVLGPLALVLSALIANEAQTLIGLHLDRVALAIYLIPFLSATAAIVVAVLRHEAARLATGDGLEQLLGLAGNLLAPKEPAAPPAQTLPPIPQAAPAPAGPPTPPPAP